MLSPAYKPPTTVEELLQRYNSGERFFVGVELDTSSYDLQDKRFEDADFSRSFITADFRRANLKRASFADANIKTCDFREADLTGANFSGAALEDTRFKGANFEGVCFTDATCYGHTMKEGEIPWW